MTQQEQTKSKGADLHLRIMIETLLRRGASEEEIIAAVEEAQTVPLTDGQLHRAIDQARGWLQN